MAVNCPSRQIRRIIKYWLPVLLCMGFIFYASSIPASKAPSLFPFQDIAFHSFIYSILGYLFCRALKNTYPDIMVSRIMLFTLAFAVFYGASDELHQAFAPYRTVSGFDIFIDGIGSFAGAITELLPQRIRFVYG
jgi:VanZ family protein